MTQVRKINGIPVVDTSVTGVTYDGNNNLTISQDNGQNYSVSIDEFSGLTVNGGFSADTIYSGSTNLYDIFATSAGSGEVNTASNIGGGTGLFKQKSALDLEFRTLTGTSPSYKITTAVSGDTVAFDINEQNMTLWPLVVSGNQLISGGANLLSGLTFSVSTLVYIIGSNIYNASASTVTLNSGGTTYDRIDVLYADVSGNTGFVQGTEAQAPVKPPLDSATQVEVTFVTVAAGSSTPEVAITKIYDEDTGTGGGEWDFSANTAVRISGDSTNAAFSGTKSIGLINAISGDEFTLANPTPYNTAEDNTISFYIKNITDWSSVKEFIGISFRDSGGTQNGSTVRFDEGKFGFDASNVFDWQVISIALGTFNMTSSMVSQVRFEVNKDAGASSSLDLNIDLIRFQAGAPTTSPQSIWLSFLADDSNSAIATSSTDQLRLSGGSNISTAINGKSAIFSLNDDIAVSSLSATTISGDTIYSGSTDLSSIFSTTDSYVTGTSFNDTTITLDRNNGLSALTTDLTGINIEVNFLKDSAGTINVGEVVFGKNWNDANSVVSVALADATSGGGTMPAIGICTVSGSSTVQGSIITNGTHVGFDTSAWGLNNALYVSEIAGQLTNVRPTGDTADIQVIGRVLKVDAVVGVIAVYGAGRSNDVPNLASENFWIGGADSIAVEKSVNDFTNIGTPATDDFLMIWDTDAAATKKVAWSGVSITTSANIGGGEGIFSAKVGTVNQFKSLTSSGATIAITTSGDTINLESIAGTGQDNTASNVGGETGLFKQKTGVDLEFKTLSAGTNIQIFSGDNVVTISGPASSGEANTASSVGSGNSIFKQKVGVDLQFRSLSAGTNITITTGDTITINSTATGGGGSSRTTGSTTTTTATPTVIATVSNLTDNATNIVEVYVKAYQTSAAQYGVWKNTLTVTKVSGTPVIQLVNADVTKTSSGLRANSVTFAVSGGNITVSVTGIAATTIGWVSAYEKII